MVTQNLGMRLVLLTGVAAFGAALFVMAPAAASAEPVRLAQAAGNAQPVVARGRRADRPRARILVTPRYPYRRTHSIYPIPYPVEYPGPNAVRHCADWYVAEYRPSGTVITPRMRCWWAPR
jgi:hypothetical protein